eukprot:gene15729-21850_t
MMPFQFGFSQGSAVAAALCALQQQQQAQEGYWFKFAILASGFPASAPELLELHKDVGPIILPSLHIYGGVGASLSSPPTPPAQGVLRRPCPPATLGGSTSSPPTPPAQGGLRGPCPPATLRGSLSSPPTPPAQGGLRGPCPPATLGGSVSSPPTPPAQGGLRGPCPPATLGGSLSSPPTPPSTNASTDTIMDVNTDTTTSTTDTHTNNTMKDVNTGTATSTTDTSASSKDRIGSEETLAGDRQIGPRLSEQLALSFELGAGRCTFRHAQGHIIPANKACVAAVRSFLEQFLTHGA